MVGMPNMIHDLVQKKKKSFMKTFTWTVQITELNPTEHIWDELEHEPIMGNQNKHRYAVC